MPGHIHASTIFGTISNTIDYAEITANVNVTATTIPGTLVVSGNPVTYDGATAVWVEFGSPSVDTAAVLAGFVLVSLLEDGVYLCDLAVVLTPAAAVMRAPVQSRRKITPTAGAHTYVIHAARDGGAGTATIEAGTGTGGTRMPAYIQIERA